MDGDGERGCVPANRKDHAVDNVATTYERSACWWQRAARADGFHQSQTMVVGVLHFTHEVEITARSNHGATILVAARCPALPRRAAISFQLLGLTHFNSARG
jgi:hypothetical protein